MVSYCTTEFSFGILILTGLSFGYEKSWRIRILTGLDLEITPKGDDTNGVYGWVENGPAILSRLKLFCIWFSMTSLCF